MPIIARLSIPGWHLSLHLTSKELWSAYFDLEIYKWFLHTSKSHYRSPRLFWSAVCIQQPSLFLQHLVIPRLPQSDNNVNISVRMLVHCETQGVIKHSKQSYRPQVTSKHSLPFTWITGPATDPSIPPRVVFLYPVSWSELACPKI